MAKPPELIEILPQDFKEDEQELIQKVAQVYNNLLRQTVSALSQNLNFTDNMDSQVAVHEHIAGSSSTFNYTRKNPPVGLWIINIHNLSNPSEVLSNAPFAQWEVNSNNQIVINNITGLTTANTYRITFLIITG